MTQGSQPRLGALEGKRKHLEKRALAEAVGLELGVLAEEIGLVLRDDAGERVGRPILLA
eukprot:CAMPEP_0119390218 /NCGR_PEP_ID=MMETSP1334-20130426/112442_1 /TAXON_ID=127549 /ORGANISM="Calcidiscus leptoporus, Strain RCC1130" /LENGTH=58 /DNA_ID=CAMNT_0007412653 /DNA_START=39 /DNA_END=211 /DNA_ORIENTATION=+